jgi:hypothetical protein
MTSRHSYSKDGVETLTNLLSNKMPHVFHIHVQPPSIVFLIVGP